MHSAESLSSPSSSLSSSSSSSAAAAWSSWSPSLYRHHHQYHHHHSHYYYHQHQYHHHLDQYAAVLHWQLPRGNSLEIDMSDVDLGNENEPVTGDELSTSLVLAQHESDTSIKNPHIELRSGMLEHQSHFTAWLPRLMVCKTGLINLARTVDQSWSTLTITAANVTNVVTLAPKSFVVVAKLWLYFTQIKGEYRMSQFFLPIPGPNDDDKTIFTNKIKSISGSCSFCMISASSF